MQTKLGKLELTAIAGIFSIYLILIITAPAGFWIVDEGNKFLWSKNLFENGSYLLEDSASRISPDHTAFIRPFSIETEPGKHLTSFSPLFITLITPLIGWGGLKLGLMFPAVVAILLILGTVKLRRKDENI